MPDAIYLKLDRLGDVMADQFKAWMSDPSPNVFFAACEVVIESENLLAFFHQPVDQVGANKASAACD